MVDRVGATRLSAGGSMVVKILIQLLGSYDFTILQLPTVPENDQNRFSGRKIHRFWEELRFLVLFEFLLRLTLNISPRRMHIINLYAIYV